MYVRTTYATGDPAKIDESLDGLRVEAPKLLADQPGYRGFGLFADRELGKIMMGSWWESEQARQSSDDHLKDRRAALLAPFAHTVTVDNWEAAVFTPSPQVQAGAGFRLSRFDVDPSNVDLLVQTFQNTTLPKLQAIAGVAGAALLIDRAKGRGNVGTLFTDRAALVASRGKQSAARGEAVAKVGVAMRSMEEFEVVLVERQ
ncbi:antibiotic biosynthesis monooxygenase [Streptomyces sp. H27-D2]|uniref:antibiotic biosynthesis monooxygenase n=1 Tax=Streptomyces sp. H27-D2 TaxID=3046304 RepID=UPI002DB591D0|nr:antibiotic biosynthesis monooxygenase [Streptomyces sp. H27-D2]MEC4017446.1 antibiotic biosynthesis monooxygenase [Streptomyces sp. H27-D2]